MSLHNENMSFKNETFMRFLNSIETHEEKSFDAGFKQTAQACFQRTMGSASIAYKQAVAFLSRYQQPPGDNELDIRLWNARKKIMDNVAQHRNEIEKYQKSRLVTSDRDTASLVLFHIVLFDYTKQHVAEAALVCAWHFFRVLQNGVLRKWNKDPEGYLFSLRFAAMELADHSRTSELSAGACAYLIALGLGIRPFLKIFGTSVFGTL